MKRFLAGILAIALLCTSVLHVQTVQAQTQSDWLAQENANTTKEQYQGLNFNTLEYNYYYANETLNQLPATFEATIRVTTTPYRAGIILSNSKYEDSATTEKGTFSFGFHKGMIPYLYVADAENTSGILYRFDKHGHISVDEETGEETISGYSSGSYKDFHTSEWVHLAIVNDAENETMTCYVNGEVYASATSSDGSTYYDAANWVMSKAMVLGGDWRTGNTQQFIGDIKNVSIYADARNAEEIASDCAAMKVENANYSPTADENLMACYVLGLDTTAGLYPKTLEDLSANSYDMETYDWLTEAEMTEKGLTISSDDYSYSMAVIGDPQVLSANTAKNISGDSSKRDSVTTLYQWVKDNAEAKNMKFAFNMGDTVDSSVSSTSTNQWLYGSNAVKLLDGTVPYSIVRGNHDSIAYYNQYYSYDEYKDSIAGSFDENMLNTYQKFEVGDIKYLVLNLDFGIGASSTYYEADAKDARKMGDGSGNPDEVLAWANDVVKANPGYNVILTTHGYTDADGNRLQHTLNTTTGAPTNTSSSKEGYQRAYSGEDIYEKLVKDNSNIVLVLSGHIGTEEIKQRTVTREDGSNVVEMLVNPQTTDQYLDVTGLVAMLYFSEANTETNKQDVTIQYYSTLRDKYYLTENQNIKITLDVIDDTTIENEDGSVVLSYDLVDTSGEYPVSISEDYKDYLFAGWFTDETCETAITDASQVTETSYAKFKPSEILDIKVQVTNGIVTGQTSEATMKYNDKYVVRFVSSVDCLDYSKIGFEVEAADGSYKAKSSSKTVFRGIESTNAGSEYNFSPKVIAEQSEYFITAKLPVAPEDAEKDYIVRAYWETLDGSIVYGKSRCVSVNDNNVLKGDTETDTINMVVNGELTGSSYAASFVSSSDNSVTTDDFTVSGAAVEVLNVEDGYSNVRITLPAKGDISKMASLTKIAIDDTDYYGMFRNYYTSHESGDVSAPHADTSWYYASEDTSKFVIASSADLYGLATIVNAATDLFEGNTVTLVGDITVNKGTAWKNSESVDEAYVWWPIGRNSSGTAWKGTFDGDGNNISGLYTVHRADGTGNYDNPMSTYGYVGFFGTSLQGSFIKNLSLTNSYFDSDASYLAGIVSWSTGEKFENIYCDVSLIEDEVNITAIGGLVGRWDANNGTGRIPFTMNSCWFDGTITSSVTKIVGGLVGQSFRDVRGIQFTDCLYTGEIDCGYTGSTAGYYAGGFYATQSDGSTHSTNKTISFVNCLSAGSIIATHSNAAINTGSVAGNISRSTTLEIENCYSVCDVSAGKSDTQAIEYGTIHTNNSSKWTSWTTTKDNLASKSLEELFGEDHAWTTVEGMDVPVLAEFAHTWQKINSNNN